jgi:hypothetical protein
MKDYTDYHRFSWVALRPPTPPLLKLLHRLPGYLIFLSVVYFNYTTKIFNELDATAQKVVGGIVTFFSLILVGAIHLILNRIDSSRGPQLIEYQIDKQGIHMGNKTYPHAKKLDLHYPDEETRAKSEKALKHYQAT